VVVSGYDALRYLDGISASVQVVVCIPRNLPVNSMEACFLFLTLSSPYSTFLSSPDFLAFEIRGRDLKARVPTGADTARLVCGGWGVVDVALSGVGFQVAERVGREPVDGLMPRCADF